MVASDEATAIDAVTNQSTTASVVTENHDSEDVHSFDSIVSRGFGNLSLKNTQTSEGEYDLRDDISDLSTDDTSRNTAAASSFTHTEVGSNAANHLQSPVQETPESYSRAHLRKLYLIRGRM